MIVIRRVRIDEATTRCHAIRCAERGNHLVHMLDKASLDLTDSLWVAPIPGFFSLID